MTFMKTYRFKLMPDFAQEKKFRQWLGITRYVYNLCLEYKKTLYKDHGISIGKNDMQKELAVLKNDIPWMADVHSQVIQATTDRMFLAYDNFFRRIKKGETPGFPKFTNKNRHKSFLFKQGVRILAEEPKVFLPKIGHVRFHKSQEVLGTVKTASIQREPSGWYICLACEVDITPMPSDGGIVGIDLGLKHAVVTSDGEVFDGPKALKIFAHRIKKAQQKLSRKRKGSNNKKKTIKELSLLHERVRNIRKDFLHKTSSQLICENQAIVVEDLQVANMTRRCKPKQDEGGKFVRNGQAAKGGLNRSFADASLGMLASMMEYKAAWYGRTFVRVPAHHTSTDCSVCGWRNHELTLAVRKWQCGGCGAEHDRDENAANNIIKRGMDKLKGAGAPLLNLEIHTEIFEPIVAEAEEPIHTSSCK